MAGAGQGVMALNEYLASSERDDIMKAILERRQRQQDEMDAMLMSEVGMRRGETPEAEREQALGEFTGQLRAARAASPGSLGARGAVSDREAAAMGELTGDLGEFAGREADITSRIDAPLRMRHEQGLRQGRLGTGLREKGRLMESADFLDQLRLARARPNPWLNMLGEGMKAAGGAMAGGMGGGGGKAPLGQSASANFDPSIYD
jgi:hypothetical protein